LSNFISEEKAAKALRDQAISILLC